MLVIDTTSELWTRSILLHLITQSTANIVLYIFLQANITFHTIHLILCFQQASKIDNLTVKLGQSILVVLYAGSTLATKSLVLCRTKFHHQHLQSDHISYWFDKPWFLTERNLLLHSSYLPLGVSQQTCELHVSVGQIGVLHSGQHVPKMVGLDVCGSTCPKGAKDRPSWRDRSVFMWSHMTKR